MLPSGNREAGLGRQRRQGTPASFPRGRRLFGKEFEVDGLSKLFKIVIRPDLLIRHGRFLYAYE